MKELRVPPRWFAIACIVLLSLSHRVAMAADSSASQATESPPASRSDDTPSSTSKSTSDDPSKEPTDWGSYYDPQNVFCGKFDCYKILGLDYEARINQGLPLPDRKEITQRYRSLSREWHPDKNRSKGAKSRFVKISKAYEVLTNEKTRKEYDAMRYNQELYTDVHGANILWSYAPKSDALLVSLLLLLAATGISWLLQKQKWQQVANRLIRAAVEDWGPREGGTPESRELREKAMKILQERNGENGSSDATHSNKIDQSPSKRKAKVKMTGSEKRKQTEDSLRPIVTELVDEMHDFGAGYHKPTVKRDLLLLKVVRFPYYLVNGTWWNIRYAIRRLQKKALSEEEREVLTIRAVGDIAWASASDEDRRDWSTRDLWVAANMADWEEEQEVKYLSASEQKRYARMKKKGKKWDWGEKED